MANDRNGSFAARPLTGCGNSRLFGQMGGRSGWEAVILTDIAADACLWSNEYMDWQKVAPDFEPDGALRDIYVFDTDASEWQRVWDALRTWEPSPRLLIGGQPAAMREKVADVFAEARQEGALLSVEVAGAVVNCHFFGHDEIEFDVDPREVAGPAQLEGLERFMSLLGAATGKPVVLTMENMREAVILRYWVDARRLEWVASKGI